MDYVKEVESGINKQNAGRVVRGGRVESERRRQYRRTLERQRGSSLRMVEQPSVGRGRAGQGDSQRNGRVLLGVERGEREGKS